MCIFNTMKVGKKSLEICVEESKLGESNQTSVDNSKTLELGPLKSRVAWGSPPLMVALLDVASNWWIPPFWFLAKTGEFEADLVTFAVFS